MPILSIRHVTTYHYTKPVAFGEHRMMLRPRDDGDQHVLESEIMITPTPLQLAWSRDVFGNHVAVAQFDDRAAELRFVSNIRLDHAPTTFDAADIEESARFYPFTYAAEDRRELKRFMRPPAARREIDRWSAAFFSGNAAVGTHEVLVGMTHAMRRTFRHVSRHQKGVQDPLRTLELGSGSCRDLAVLMIAALRSRGIAARFVSGYVHLADDDEDDEDDVAGGNTHAWVQVYVPGPGWVDFDPSGGIVGNQNLVRVAVAHDPREAIPLQGTWYGSASDHLAMNVAVKVKMTDADATPTAGGASR
ncbi:MAG TPA: transglutaminase family protein [Xanthobacteraceae bacterium]|nr:transglutaminase family protein [Xanthobacteraceae bacterium]